MAVSVYSTPDKLIASSVLNILHLVWFTLIGKTDTPNGLKNILRNDDCHPILKIIVQIMIKFVHLRDQMDLALHPSSCEVMS